MRTRTALALLAAAGCISLSAMAAEYEMNWDVGVAPPPAYQEAVPPPAAGQVWSPGYWAWSGSNYVWTPGHFEYARPGYTYIAPRWVEYGDRYRFERGNWQRDNEDAHARRDAEEHHWWRRHHDRDDD